MHNALALAMADDTTVAGVQLPTWILWIIAISVVVAAVHTIYTKAVKPMRRTAKQIRATYEKVMEYDDRLSVVERHSKELVNNSGSSLRDAVDRIESGAKADRALMTEHLAWSQTEFRDVWKQIASRDVVQAAEHAAAQIERGERDNG